MPKFKRGDFVLDTYYARLGIVADTGQHRIRIYLPDTDRYQNESPSYLKPLKRSFKATFVSLGRGSVTAIINQPTEAAARARAAKLISNSSLRDSCGNRLESLGWTYPSCEGAKELKPILVHLEDLTPMLEEGLTHLT